MQTSPKRNPKGGELAMNTPPIVSPQAWEAAREQMLVKEKALTRARDALAAERRRMPWMAVEKAYEFAGRRPGRPPCAFECTRHDPRLCLACTAGRHRAAEGADGLGNSLVHHHRQ